MVATDIIYKGGWQQASTILQKLAGPIGDGEVWYPNGDHFKGAFHLSFACISGPAYAADGRYEFADGSYIENAWIHTSKDKKPQCWGLHGVFRIHHHQGPDSIAMFCAGGKRYGFELYLDEKKPWVEEWYADDRFVRHSASNELLRYEVMDYELEETNRHECTTLKLTLKDGDNIYRIEQRGGGYTTNNYDEKVYSPSTRVTVFLPNGDSLDHYGDDVRDFKPYSGYVDVHCAETGMCRNEHWKDGELLETREWKRDYRASSQLMLPNPTGAEGEMRANVWKNGHIEYNNGEWIYDGEVKDSRPDGQGVLVGDNYHNGRCFEGAFVDGVYVNEENGFTGVIMLHVKSGHRHWSISSTGDWEYEEEDMQAKLGSLGISGFWSYEITRITEDCITIEFYKERYELRPDQPLNLFSEIEGDERSDGCVYDGDDYSLELTWKK